MLGSSWESGRGRWRGRRGGWALMPPTAECRPEALDGIELAVHSGGGRAFERFGEQSEAVVDPVGWCDIRLSDAVVAELNCVGDLDCIRLLVRYVLAAVVLEGDTNTPSIAAAEVPRVARARLLVADDAGAQWSKWGGVVVKGSLEGSPG